MGVFKQPPAGRGLSYHVVIHLHAIPAPGFHSAGFPFSRAHDLSRCGLLLRWHGVTYETDRPAAVWKPVKILRLFRHSHLRSNASWTNLLVSLYEEGTRAAHTITPWSGCKRGVTDLGQERLDWDERDKERERERERERQREGGREREGERGGDVLQALLTDDTSICSIIQKK